MSGKKEKAEQTPKTEEILEKDKNAQAEVKTEEVKKEPTEIEKLTEQLNEANDRNLRLMAEFDNYRRRSQKEKDAIYPDAQAETVKKLLPLLDNFERALAMPCSDEEYFKGIKMTYDAFWDTLKEIGLEELGAVGDEFDPNMHNAVMHIEDENLGKNVVAMILQKGYKIGDRVLRYAMVQTAN